MTRSSRVALLTLVVLAAALVPLARAEDATLKTTFVLLVGRPATPPGDTPTVLIEPGTVIMPGPQGSEAAGGGYLDLLRKLSPSYRLDDLRTEKREVLDLIVGKETGVDLGLASIGASVKLLDVQEETATLEVTLTDHGKVVSQPRIMAARGKWATIGSRDGEAAPYLFLLLGPWTREDMEIGRRQKNFTAPKAIDKAPPAYPEEARKAKVTGIVVLRGTIGADGAVSNIRIIESPDDRLSTAARDAFARWRFEPGRDEKGAPVAYEFTFTMAFKLQ